jgi:hypothetical protein
MPRAHLLSCARALGLALDIGALLACSGNKDKDELFVPMPPEEHKVKILADAEGNERSPAHVVVYLHRGSLHVTGGAEVTVAGLATGAIGDPPPRVDHALDRVAIVQTIVGGAPPQGDGSFVFSLGKTPMALEVETRTGQDQVLDLGGVALVEGRFHTESGHLTIGWSAPNLLASANLTVRTERGYIDLNHLGRMGGGKVTVKTTEGFVGIDVGGFTGSNLSIDAEVGNGKLVFKVPPNVAARADVTANVSAVVALGWRESGTGYTLGDPSAAPRVVLRAQGEAARFELRAE